MNKILMKEMRLSASILSYLFILFGLMFFLPGYPILCGAFFVTLGIFQGFLSAREMNDIVYSVLLPIAKKDVVKGRYLFVCFIEGSAFVLMTIAALLRMTVFSDALIYRENALMNANFFALGFAVVIFGLFNMIFVGGFFKTAYKITKPFVISIIVMFFVIGIGEAVHYIPGFEVVNAFGFDNIILQMISLGLGVLIFVVLTIISYKKSCKSFELIDL